MMKCKCKRCGRNILARTARKYQGYSRQCLRKIESRSNSNLPLTFDEILSNLSKINTIVSKNYNIKTLVPYAYSINEFRRIYAIPEGLVDKYYENYISKIISQII